MCTRRQTAVQLFASNELEEELCAPTQVIEIYTHNGGAVCINPCKTRPGPSPSLCLQLQPQQGIARMRR